MGIAALLGQKIVSPIYHQVVSSGSSTHSRSWWYALSLSENFDSHLVTSPTTKWLFSHLITSTTTKWLFSHLVTSPTTKWLFSPRVMKDTLKFSRNQLNCSIVSGSNRIDDITIQSIDEEDTTSQFVCYVMDLNEGHVTTKSQPFSLSIEKGIHLKQEFSDYFFFTLEFLKMFFRIKSGVLEHSLYQGFMFLCLSHVSTLRITCQSIAKA